MKTTSEFMKFLNDLEARYLEDEETWRDCSILEFLDSEGVTADVLKEINPFDVILEIYTMDVHFGFGKDTKSGFEFSPRFVILMGLCEEITYVNAKSRISVGDVIRNIETEWIGVVTEVDHDAGWVAKDFWGEKWIDYGDRHLYEKIGHQNI